MKLRTQLIVGNLLVLVLLVTIAAVSYYSVVSLTNTNNELNKQRLLISQAEELGKNLVTMQASQRGFLLSGDEEILKLYLSLKNEIPTKFQQLKKQTVSGSKQLKKLESFWQLVERWQEKVAGSEISTRQKIIDGAKGDRYLQNVLSKGVGKAISDELRDLLDELQALMKEAKDERGEILVLYVAKDLVDQETGERGFLITGNEDFLTPFDAGSDSLEEHLSDLKSHLKDQHRALALLKQIKLKSKKWKSMAATPEIEARLEMNKITTTWNSVLTIVKRDSKEKTMLKIQQELRDFIVVEQDSIEAGTIIAKELASFTSRVSIFGTVLALILGITTLYILVRQVMSRIGEEPQIILGITQQVANGELDIEFANYRNATGIFAGVIGMIKSLAAKDKENRQQNWLKTELTRILGASQNIFDLQSMAQFVISELSPLIGAGHGIFYVQAPKKAPALDLTLELFGSYGFEERRNISNTYKPGQGLVGQCALEKKAILLTEVPSDYVKINSGLGAGVALNIYVTPILLERKVVGVLEFASFHLFTSIQKELLDQIAANLGPLIGNIISRQRTESLLLKHQQLSEQARQQAEELRVTNEELQAKARVLRQNEQTLQQQREALVASNEDLEEQTRFLEEQAKEIKRSKKEVEDANESLQLKASELQQASKYKSQFLANMSHELRTPLNSLLILSQMLAKNSDGNLTPDQVKAASIIYSGGKDLLTLINDILDLSKVEAGQLELYESEFLVQDLIHEIKLQINPLAEKKKLDYQVELATNCPAEIYTDKKRVAQILKNLLSNAIKFTETGLIRMKFGLANSNVHFRSDLDPTKTLAISVVDTGIGISEEKQESVFAAFHQEDGSTNRRFGGTGLGLTISRELSALLGGEIHLQSELGKGSTFTLYLPLHSAGESKVGTVASDSAAGGLKKQTHRWSSSSKTPLEAVGGNKILIIEDEAHFSELLASQAKTKGYECLHAYTGKEGLAIAKLGGLCGIILDLGLPDMDGILVLESLKGDVRTHSVPVHIVSGRDPTNSSIEQQTIGFLKKPASLESLSLLFGKIENEKEQRVSKILIVEDDVAGQEAILQLLQPRGYVLTFVSSGQGACEKLRQEKFDCVILDLTLGDMNGSEILKRLRKFEVAIPPVIVYTGQMLSQEDFDDLADSVSEVVIKGVHSAERLLDEVSLFLYNVEQRAPPRVRRGKWQESQDPASNLKGRKILIVDDEVRNSFALSGVLTQEGFEVILADNGEHGLEMLREHDSVDLVLMDIMMPIMDGYEATAKIREQVKYKDLPIIAVTAKAMVEDRNDCLKAGASDYITKPVEIPTLLAMIRIWLFRTKGT
jgi:CheY-like chemotaxis protein